MDIILVILGTAVLVFLALVIQGTVFRRRLASYKLSKLTREISDRDRLQSKAHDLAAYLRVLSREVANELMQRNPDVYYENFGRLLNEWSRLRGQSDEVKSARLKEITDIYTTFEYFDEIQMTYPHFFYSEAFEYHDDESLWILFRDMRLFSALMRELDEFWSSVGQEINREEQKEIWNYLHKIRESKLLAHLQDAVCVLRDLQSNNVRARETGWHFETSKYGFLMLPMHIEDRWGIFVKELGEYGIYGVFHGEKTSESFYVSDERFEREDELMGRFFHRVAMNSGHGDDKKMPLRLSPL